MPNSQAYFFTCYSRFLILLLLLLTHLALVLLTLYSVFFARFKTTT